MSFVQILISLSLIYYASAVSWQGVKPSSASCRIFPNEEYIVDAFRCQVTCEKYGDPTCSEYAPEGDCYCKEGYARLSANGLCIPVNSSLCRAKMPSTEAICAERQNEELTEWLYDGYPCGNTCSNYKVPCDKMVPMAMIWSPHCVCKNGYSRLPNGKCVRIDEPDCYALWKPSAAQCLRRGNEVYNSGSACQETCADLIASEPTMCIMSIVEDCYCPEGKVRLHDGGECVAKEYCPSSS